MERLHQVAVDVSQGIANHPIGTAVGGVASALIAFLQGSQQVASTLIALVTSITGLLAAALALRSAWRNRNKE